MSGGRLDPMIESAHMRAALLAAATLLVAGTAHGEPLKVRDYAPATLAVIRPPAGAADGRAALLGRDARYLLRVEYAGRSRAVNAAKRAAIAQWLKARKMKPELVTVLGTEYAFRESDRQYWLPVYPFGNGLGAAPAPVTLLAHHGGWIGDEPLLVAMVAAPGWEARDKALEADARMARRMAARSLVETIRTCAETWRERNPEAGFPQTLAELGPRGDGCLDAAVVNGAPFEYQFRYVAGPPDASGQVRLYLVCAQPTGLRQTQAVTFVADEEGLFPALEPGQVNCVQAEGSAGWSFAARAVKLCLIAYAAANPTEGFPRDLKAISADGDGCLPRSFKVGVGGSLETEFESLRYAPKAEPTGGALRGFELRVRSWPMPASTLLMDETGVLRIAHGRDARPDDPTLDQENELNTKDIERARSEADAFQAGCESGRMTDCVEAGFRYFLMNDARALPNWEHACARGVKEACLLTKSQPFEFEIFEWTLNLRRACFRGDLEGCRQLKEYVARTNLKPGR